MLMRGERLYGVDSEEEADVLVCLHLVRVYYRSHDLHVQFQPSGTEILRHYLNHINLGY